ncbi:mechanosensitive ion channel family protein [Barnesiella viscericola]|uniref:Mechanosensitive ion channel family protein n=1 Tax=Barnesiella viscericola TaxID=397865 RepID=A0A921MS29_9BACT|nr:mechanosensitive ion channel domain-containing protein [Barnesiella viscericola]HJG89550.1 mechanosensitive ion channel family protein [Barnesiella viscericola]
MKKAYEIADRLMEWVSDLLLRLTGSPSPVWDRIVYGVLVFVIAIVVGRILRAVVIYVIHRVARYRGSYLLKSLVEAHIFTRLTHIIPPLVIVALLPFAFHGTPAFLKLIEKLCWIYILGVIVFSINTQLSVFWKFYSSRTALRNRPMKGMIQIIKGLLAGFWVIVAVSILIERSPMALITGLGAFAAVLMLVFKDSILGFVAGVQLSQNDMIRNGDWIVVPGGSVNGIVIDVSLDTVKVQNFDNTIVTLPPYSLVSGEVQNWRGMTEAGGRRIMRSFTIDLSTVKFCTPEFLEKMKEIDVLRDFIEKKEAQQQRGVVENTQNSEGLVNGTIETNLGLFRAYMTLYLQHHKFIGGQMILMVRALDPNDNGLPLQLYCFSTNTDWVSYESIQSEIFEHYAAIMPRFGLYPFQNPSSRDYINAALLTAGHHPDELWGIPFGTMRQAAPSTAKPASSATPPQAPQPPIPPK